MEKVQANLTQIHPDWNSLRRSWPFQRSIYKVYDCKEDVDGLATYDGVDFLEVKWSEKKKGALIIKDYKISHWKPLSQ